MNEHDIRFMQHALELARQGAGLASPNPTVGCLVVRDGKIAGQGFHQYEKKAHAEVAALREAGEKARGATLYVTLEPCNHTGRTGPCTEAILAAGIARVVTAMADPNPRVTGGGLARLREHGLEVACGVEEEAAQKLNEAYSFAVLNGRPFVTLKAALTLDGQLALPGRRKKTNKRTKSDWITSEESRAEVQRMRHASDALLTGIGTIAADDPLLTDRSGLPRRRNLLRVIVDSRLKLAPKARICQSARGDVLVFTAASLHSAKARALEKAGVRVVKTRAVRGRVSLAAVLEELANREVQSVLLEAGPALNSAMLEAGLVNKLFLFYAPKFSGQPGVPLARGANLAKLRVKRAAMHSFGADFALEAYL